MRFRTMGKLNSISAKVLLAFVVGLILSVSLIIIVFVTASVLRNNIFSEVEVHDFAQELVERLVFNKDGAPVNITLESKYNWVFDSFKSEIAYRVLDQSGNVLFYSPAGQEFWSPVDTQNPPVDGFFQFERDGTVVDAAIHSIENNGNQWFVEAAVSRRFVYFAHHAFGLNFIEKGLVLLSLVLFFVFSACVHFILSHTLKPLRELSESAALISPRSLQSRLENKRVPSEIAPLVNSFNHALERLEHGYRVQQEFLATAAHELKTPLALIHAQLELTPETEERNWLLRDVNYMSRQVQQLLLLAEASEQQNYRICIVDMYEVAIDALSYLQRMADAEEVKLNLINHTSGVSLQADKGALFTLLKNLIENAIQHAGSGKVVRIVIYPDRITVRDWGHGVDEVQLSQLFNRFWRGEHRRELGAGLGLAICREIALNHDWLLTAQRMEPGLLFQLQFRHVKSQFSGEE